MFISRLAFVTDVRIVGVPHAAQYAGLGSGKEKELSSIVALRP